MQFNLYNLSFTVHGNWSDWQVSGECSTTCGLGYQFMYRYCNNPSKSEFGDDCMGNNTETVECTVANCSSKSNGWFYICVIFWCYIQYAHSLPRLPSSRVLASSAGCPEFNPQSRTAPYQRRYKNGTSSALVKHSKIKREILALSQELR